MTLDVSTAPAGAADRPVAPPAPSPVARAAVARDLNRLAGVLDEPITPVRRAALVAHVGFLADRLRDDLDGAPAVALSRLRHEARGWGRDPGRRAAVRDAAVRACAVVPAGDAPVRPGGAGESGSATVRTAGLAGLLTGRSPALAYRYFWLLDGLPPDAAASVVGAFSRPARWVLRNLLSGGYNRRAHLMWVGGGSGRAV